jgi:hypothetical protein
METTSLSVWRLQPKACALIPCSRQILPQVRSVPVSPSSPVLGRHGTGTRWASPIEEIWPGDVVWIPPAEKHWHGATATTAMTHIAIVEQLDGKTADWMEKVSDEQYRR